MCCFPHMPILTLITQGNLSQLVRMKLIRWFTGPTSGFVCSSLIILSPNGPNQKHNQWMVQSIGLV